MTFASMWKFCEQIVNNLSPVIKRRFVVVFPQAIIRFHSEIIFEIGFLTFPSRFQHLWFWISLNLFYLELIVFLRELLLRRQSLHHLEVIRMKLGRMRFEIFRNIYRSTSYNAIITHWVIIQDDRWCPTNCLGKLEIYYYLR